MIAITFDIETTNFLKFDDVTHLLRDDCELLEFAYIRHDVNLQTKTSRFIDSGVLYFYKDYFVLDNEAAEFHKLTREFLEPHKDKFNKNLLKLACLVNGSLLIGKNSKSFDIVFIENFLNKHSAFSLNFSMAFGKAKIPPMGFEKNPGHMDIQQALYKEWQTWYYEEQGNPVHGRKKLGTLEQYVKWLNLEEKVNELYASLPKERETGYHGGLYDTCCTHVLFKYCLEHEIGGF